MAILAMQSAASALSALNTQLDVSAHNLANVNTAGFKSSRTNFQDLLYVARAQPGVENSIGDIRPTGLFVGLGVKVSGTQLDFAQGPALITENPLDVRISGEGFFQVQIENGQIAYSRAGNFIVNRDGELTLGNDQGRRLEPGIQIPENAEAIDISSDGRVFVTVQGEAEPQEVGQIELATFINPAGLRPVGENLYVESDGSGPPTTGAPGEESRGSLIAGMLEASNVDPTRELIELIRTQRAFEMNSQSIRAADETLRSVAQLRR
ncbi:MAG: flagellar basal-body rod protein FlgG [Phycisphaeraceae bacterium]|nr:flagellar basal-body rod protein FlgG [Phycisphaeraceae bacterium]